MQASLANTDWYTGVTEVEIQRQKNTRPFVHNDPFLSGHITQSKDTVWPVFVRGTLQKGKGQRSLLCEAFLIASLLRSARVRKVEFKCSFT